MSDIKEKDKAVATPQKVRASYDYAASSEWELTIHEGDIIEVIGTFDDGWWSGRLDGKIGLFPKEYCVPVAVTPKLRVDESRASNSIRRMQMQLGFLKESGAKVAELTQEVEALKADVALFKKDRFIPKASPTPNGTPSLFTVSSRESTPPSLPSSPVAVPYNDSADVEQLKRALAEEVQRRKDMEQRFKADLQKMQEKLTAAELAKSILQDKVKGLEKAQQVAKEDSAASEGSRQLPNDASSGNVGITLPQNGPVTDSKLEEELKKVRATTLVRLWRMQVLKAQLRSTLDHLDEVQKEKTDIEESYKLKIQKLLSLLEKERRAKLAPPPVPSSTRKSGWFSHLMESKEDKEKKKSEKEKEIVVIRRKCEEMEVALDELKKANESLINLNRVLMVQLREVMLVQRVRSPSVTSPGSSSRSPREEEVKSGRLEKSRSSAHVMEGEGSQVGMRISKSRSSVSLMEAETASPAGVRNRSSRSNTATEGESPVEAQKTPRGETQKPGSARREEENKNSGRDEVEPRKTPRGDLPPRREMPRTSSEELPPILEKERSRDRIDDRERRRDRDGDKERAERRDRDKEREHKERRERRERERERDRDKDKDKERDRNKPDRLTSPRGVSEDHDEQMRRAKSSTSPIRVEDGDLPVRPERKVSRAHSFHHDREEKKAAVPISSSVGTSSEHARKRSGTLDVSHGETTTEKPRHRKSTLDVRRDYLDDESSDKKEGEKREREGEKGERTEKDRDRNKIRKSSGGEKTDKVDKEKEKDKKRKEKGGESREE